MRAIYQFTPLAELNVNNGTQEQVDFKIFAVRRRLFKCVRFFLSARGYFELVCSPSICIDKVYQYNIAVTEVPFHKYPPADNYHTTSMKVIFFLSFVTNLG